MCAFIRSTRARSKCERSSREPPRRGPAKLPRTLLGSLGRPPHWYPVPAFLVEHPSAGPFLIDVGYDPSISSDPRRTLGFVFGKVVLKHRLAGPSLPEHLTARGVDPSQVSSVVMTHLHNDHISGSAQWPQATFVVDKAERAAADGPGPYVKSHLATIDRWREIDSRGRRRRRSRASAGPSTSSATASCG